MSFRYAYNCICDHRLTMSHVDISSMFLLGLFGTGHCLGMCGPLVLAFPGATGRILSHVFYHLGRVVAYLSIGAAMGAIGPLSLIIAEKSGADPLVWTMRVRPILSITVAACLMLYGLSRLGVIHLPARTAGAPPVKLRGPAAFIRFVTSKKGRANMLLLGFIFGFLPCGLSFAAFARAASAGGSFGGVVLVAAFTAGTLPGLFLLGTGASRFAVRYRTYFDKVSGALVIGMAISLFFHAFRHVVRW